jgi:hypothetical protein
MNHARLEITAKSISIWFGARPYRRQNIRAMFFWCETCQSRPLLQCKMPANSHHSLRRILIRWRLLLLLLSLACTSCKTWSSKCRALLFSSTGSSLSPPSPSRGNCRSSILTLAVPSNTVRSRLRSDLVHPAELVNFRLPVVRRRITADSVVTRQCNGIAGRYCGR